MSIYTKRFIITITIFFFILSNEAAFATTNAAYTFVNTRSIHLRDENLKNPQVVDQNASINIDPEFYKEHLGSETPSLDKIQQLLLNPTEVSSEIVTENAVNSVTGRVFSDYFFPVIIKINNSERVKGRMALQAYNRNGQMDIRNSDGSEIDSNQISGKMKTLKEQSKQVVTEAGDSKTCPTCETATLKTQVNQISEAITTSVQKNSNSLYLKYQDFTREFLKNNGKITRRDSGSKKRLFIKSLVDKFGVDDATKILASLTGFGEAPDRKSSSAQIAEISAILKVIQNRARVQFRTKSSTLKNIGISTDLNSTLTTILANSQFSVWNDFDNGLIKILNFNPDKADPLTKRRMAMSFETQSMMESNKIEFLGKMNSDKLYHYHANYVAPNWAERQKRVGAPIVRIKQQNSSGKDEFVDVNLQNQSGARHLFYAGIR